MAVLFRDRQKQRNRAKLKKQGRICNRLSQVTEDDETEKIVVVGQLTCALCGATCVKKSKGATIGRCSRKAKANGEEKPKCNFTNSSAGE